MAKEDSGTLGDDNGVDNPLTHDVGDDNGVDDPLTHDVGDDNGVDDPLTHDVGDDNGVDDPLTHDVGDDNGVDDPLTHDVGDDNGVDDPLAHDVGDDNGVDDPLAHDVGDDHGGMAFRLYLAAFDRVPDLEGLKYWVGQVAAGTNLLDVAAGFIASDEFESLYGVNPTDQAFTQALYRNVLHREPDAAGYTYWGEVLGSGATTREQMLVAFSESAENKANVVEMVGVGFDDSLWQ